MHIWRGYAFVDHFLGAVKGGAVVIYTTFWLAA